MATTATANSGPIQRNVIARVLGRARGANRGDGPGSREEWHRAGDHQPDQTERVRGDVRRCIVADGVPAIMTTPSRTPTTPAAIAGSTGGAVSQPQAA